MADRADTKTGLAVVVVGAFSGDVVTSVSGSAPASTSVEGQTLAASVVGCAARRNSDAGVLLSAPRITGLANTFASLTVMVVGASGGNVVASVGQRAPAGSGLESNASGAVIVSETTRRNFDAGELSNTPNVVGRAQTFESLTVVACRASGGNVVTVVGNRAPSSSSVEGQTVSAAVVGGTTRRHENA